MKILLIADPDVVHSRRYLDLINKAGCDAVLLGSASPPANLFAVRCYRWPRSGVRFTRRFMGSRLANKLGEIAVRLQLWWLWRVTRADVAHVQWIDDRAWLLAKAGVTPLVLTAWGTDLNRTRDPNYNPAELRRMGEAISKAALLIADNQDMVEIAENLVGSRINSMLLPIGIDTSFFLPAMKSEAAYQREKLNIPQNAIVALSPRALRPNYGHDAILQAFAGASKKTGIDAYLIFKAYDCWDKSYIERLSAIAAKWKIQHRIRILEEMPYENLPTYYAMGDFAINFPTMDGFPVTFLECLSCELPVLTKYLPAYESLGISSYLRFTNAGNEESLELSISEMLLLLQTSRPDMSSARAFVSQNFDELVVAKSLARAYDAVINAISNSRKLQRWGIVG